MSAAARASTTYYGQMAHARIGGAELRLPAPPAPHPQGARLEIVRAMDMLYAIDERDLVASATADLADRAVDPAALAAVAALAERKGDARTLALLGRTAVGARPAVRILRLSDRRTAAGQADRRRRMSSRMSPMRSRGRKAASTRAPSRAPRRRG